MGDPFIGPTNLPTAALPSVWQTDRQDIQNAITQMAALFVTTYPGYVLKVSQERPTDPATGEVPLIYIGRIREVILHDQGTRQTTFEGEIGYCDRQVPPDEWNTRANIYADFMREVMTVNARMLPAGIFEETGFDDAPEVKQGTSVFASDVQISWRYVILEGRN